MRKQLLRYSLKLLIFTAVILVVALGLYFTVLQEYYLQIYPLLLFYFVILTYIIHIVLLKASEMRPQKFVNKYLLLTTVKLLINIVIITVYLFLNREKAVPFLIVFLIHYLVYTFFEVAFFSEYLRKSSNKKRDKTK